MLFTKYCIQYVREIFRTCLIVTLFCWMSIFSAVASPTNENLGTKLLQQIETDTVRINIQQCADDLKTVYRDSLVLYTVAMTDKPFLLETFFNWEMGYRIALPLTFTVQQQSYQKFFEEASLLLTKHVPYTTVTDIPSELLDSVYTGESMYVSSKDGTIPFYLVNTDRTIRQFRLPVQCFPDDVVYDNYDDVEYTIDSDFSYLNAHFQLYNPNGKSISGQVSFKATNIEAKRLQQNTSASRKTNASDFQDMLYIGVYPNNRTSTKILVDTGHDDTLYDESRHEVWSRELASTPLIIQPGFLNAGSRGIRDAIDKVLYFTLTESSQSVLNGIEQVYVQVKPRDIFGSTNSSRADFDPTASVSNQSSVPLKVIKKSKSGEVVIAIGGTTDPNEALRIAQHQALDSFIDEYVSVSPFFTRYDKEELKKTVVASNQYILQSNLDFYSESESTRISNLIFQATVQIDAPTLLRQTLKNYPKPTEVSLTPLVKEYRTRVEIVSTCRDALRDVFLSEQDFWKVRQNGDIQIEEKNEDSVTLTIPLKFFIDNSAYTTYLEVVDNLLNMYRTPSKQLVPVMNNYGLPWGEVNNTSMFYLATGKIDSTGKLETIVYNTPCGFTDDDAEYLRQHLADMTQNNFVSLRLTNLNGALLLNNNYPLDSDAYYSLNDYYNRSSSMYLFQGLNIIGPLFFDEKGKRSNGYYNVSYYPFETFTDSFERKIHLTLSKETVKQISAVELEFKHRLPDF